VTNIKDILDQRKQTHGDFTENAEIHQALLGVLAGGSTWHKCTAVQMTALQVICGKLARIVTGDPTHRDSWDDIAGYAILVSERIKE